MCGCVSVCVRRYFYGACLGIPATLGSVCGTFTEQLFSEARRRSLESRPRENVWNSSLVLGIDDGSEIENLEIPEISKSPRLRSRVVQIGFWNRVRK